ncbi:UNVERIFIED_CONTAM: hypothetical protein GTU68_043128 [Idotea baltica]|nr:hypothetical protein [Idotea baltica]
MIEKALKFATQAHEGQLRKYTGEPYIVHPIAVSKIVEGVTDDEDMIVAALLHDTVEDTDVTLEMVEENFGLRVATFVENLTDISTPDQGNRATRKQIDLDHTAKATPEAKTIKLADLIHNTGSITKYDKKFAAVYIKEKKALLAVLSEGDKGLYKKALHLVNSYYREQNGS